MKITTITTVFAIIACFSIWRIFVSIRGERIGMRSGIVWIGLWLCIGFFALFPNLLDKVMLISQMESRMFFLLVVAVFILFALVFNLVSRIATIQRDISTVVREIALVNNRIDESLQKDNENKIE